MADVLTHIDTLDVEVAPQEELDVTVGSPMEHSRVLSITKNGKHVVSEYDLAEVEVQPLPKQDKVVEITENGVTEVTADDDAHILGKVTINTDATKQVMTDIVNKGYRYCYSHITNPPDLYYDKIINADYLFTYSDITSVKITTPFSSASVFTNAFNCANLTSIDITIPNAQSMLNIVGYTRKEKLTSIIFRRLGENGKTLYPKMVNLSLFPNLTKESIIELFDNLADISQSTGNGITLGTSNFAKVTEEEIKIATDKGWIVTQ